MSVNLIKVSMWRVNKKTFEIKEVTALDPNAGSVMVTLFNGRDKFGTRVSRDGEVYVYFYSEIEAQCDLVRRAMAELDEIQKRTVQITNIISAVKPKIEAYIRQHQGGKTS